ncbi:MAG: flagellar hook-length control protein FliK [Cellulosilyticaceae bacterium]
MNNLAMNLLSSLPTPGLGAEGIPRQNDAKNTQNLGVNKDKKFDDVIREHRKPEKPIDKTQSNKVETSKTESNKAESNKDDRLEVSKPENDNTTKKLDANKSARSEKTTEAEKTDSTTEDSEKILANVEDIVMSMVLETLNITPEELESIMGKMQIDALDLLDENVFREFVMQLQEGDLSQVLMEGKNIKELGKLWEKLESIGIAFEINKQEMNASELTLNQETLKSSTTPVKDTSVTDNNVMNEIALSDPNVAKITIKQQGEQGIQLRGTQLDETPKTSEVSLQTEGESPKGQFILQMPVTGLEKGAGMQLWGKQQEVLQKGVLSQTQDIETQIIKKIEINALRQGKEIQMELNPRELGKLALRVTENSGVVTANIRVESERTKEMLMQNLSQLKEGLEKQGLAIGEFNIDVRKEQHQSEMYKQKQKSSKRIEEIIAKHLEELETEEIAEPVISDTEIDYMA